MSLFCKMKPFYAFFLLLAITFSEVKASQTAKSHKSSECPTFKHIADFSKPSEVKRMQDEIMYNLWSIDTPALTDLGEDLVDALYDLVECDKPSWRRYALSVTELIWAYLPDIDRGLNLCSYAEIINKTLDFVDNKDCDSILKAIESSGKAFQEAGFRLTENSIRNAGCDCSDVSLSQASTTKCYKKGFVYEINKMWHKFGHEYPDYLKNIVLDLYNSNEKTDKILALLATAALSKYLCILENEYDPEILYRSFAMFTPGKISSKCCKMFKKEALDLNELAQTKNVDMFKLAKKATECP